jgi:hypothetical protein
MLYPKISECVMEAEFIKLCHGLLLRQGQKSCLFHRLTTASAHVDPDLSQHIVRLGRLKRSRGRQL